MSLLKVRIAESETKDTQTKYGMRKRVSIRESLEGGDRWISVLIDPKIFNPEDWKAGNSVDLFVEQNGKYWNGKIPNRATQETAKANEEVMGALRELYKLCKEIKHEVKLLREEKESFESETLGDAQEPVFP